MGIIGLHWIMICMCVLIKLKVTASYLHPRWQHILKSDFEVTIPYISDHNGNFLSHDLHTLQHHQSVDSKLNVAQTRYKRNAQYKHQPVVFHLSFNTSKKLYHLQVVPSNHIIGNGFKVYRRKTFTKNGKKFRKTTNEDMTNFCLYKGFIIGHTFSSVAVSVCGGMMGYIHNGKEHYIIEPLPADVISYTTTSHTTKGSNAQQHHHSSYNWNDLSEHSSINNSQSSHILASRISSNDGYFNSNKTEPLSSIYKISNQLSGVHHIIYKHNWKPPSSPRKNSESRNGEHRCGNDKSHDDRENLDSARNPFVYADDIQNSVSNSSKRSLHSKHQRLKRSTNTQYFTNNNSFNESNIRSVETIVVVDNDMLRAHGESNVTTYVLTLINMVSNLFHDNTIGTKINISLMALILLEGDEPGLVVENQADQALNNFCHWQSNLKGLHHDHAILLTGVDICSYNGRVCDTLGFAPIEGMCKRYRSCTLNEDNGLGTAFTITHEAGHNFGMRHDGDDNYCTDYTGSIMAPRLLGSSGTFKWSACSRKYLDKFLSSQQSWCLQNTPQQVSSLQFPNSLPGELYDADIQCKWQFGPASKLCSYSFAKNLCKALWCYTGGHKCETKFLPAAEGTSCGYSRWCRKGMCVSYGDEGPDPVDGHWSGWSPWTSCSRSCGTGVKYRQRSCNRPRPQYGGKDCDGDRRLHKLCNIQDCPVGSLDSRAQQCAFYNSKAFRGLPYKWIPYTNIYLAEDQCKLYCKAVNKQLYFEMNHKVDDGTKCLLDPDGICINGECLHIGCDLVVGSHAIIDVCGICGGDNKTCNVVEGEINKQFKQNQYNYLITIPKDSRSIMIKEVSLSSSYFAIRSTFGDYYLNGDWRISWPSEKLMAGTKFVYKRPYNKPEELIAEGPTTQDLIVEVLALQQSPVIKYKYTLAKAFDRESVTQPVHNYTWSVSSSHCSASCASGEKVVTARCLRDHRDEVHLSHCNVTEKPYTGVIPCNPDPCPPRWISHDWESCSKTCGGGLQRRKVLCLQTLTANETMRVRNRKCSSEKKPSKKRTCNIQECPPEWHTARWTKCSTTCGPGKRHRQVVCKIRHQKLSDNYCSHDAKPESVEICERHACFTDHQWYLSAWSKCSTSCGPGTKTRLLKCSGRSLENQFITRPQQECNNLKRPTLPLQGSCDILPCGKNNVKWFMSPWSKCSATCGEGSQIRYIRCMDRSTGKVVSGCDESNKPTTSQVCRSAVSCNDKDTGNCQDTWSMCHLVPKHGLCRHHYYGKQCCQSCKTVIGAT